MVRSRGNGMHGDEAAAARLSAIPTHWSVLKGPPKAALDYLFRVYGLAVLGYIRGRLARGDLRPLAPQDAEDIVQDLFLRLGQSEWLRKPDPSRGKFRPYLVRRIDYFLRERRAGVCGKVEPVQASVAEVAAADPLDDRLEREWRAATIRETLERIGKRNREWGEVLTADLERDEQSDAQVAKRLGKSLESFRSLLKRARAAFREIHPLVEGRLDGFGGQEF